ncbi:lysozyme [Rhizobiales bacterium GAS113]|nr:lysozyme [Rhizobiales bacterium GAS113]
MRTSAPGRAAIEQREGLKLHAYQDSSLARVWTIGYGHTSMAGAPHVFPGMVITQQTADETLSHDLNMWEAIVNRYIRRAATQNQFDAMVSLCHNIGGGGFAGSSVVRQFNAGNVQAAADDFLMWEHPANLVGRRVSERKQFLTP